MRILITGAAGFIGGHVARAAQTSGHEVLGMARTAPDSEGLQFCQGTLAAPPWREILDFQPQACLHAAWHAKPGMFWDAAENEQCVKDSLTFLDSLWRQIDCRVVITGTCAEYSPSFLPLVENSSELKPESGYARAKALLYQEAMLLAAKQVRTLGWARIFYPYGPGEPAAKITSTFIASALRDEALVIGQPASVKDFIFIEDVATALLGLLEHGAEGPVNIGSGTGVKIAELATAVVESVGRGRVEIRPSTTPILSSP